MRENQNATFMRTGFVMHSFETANGDAVDRSLLVNVHENVHTCEKTQALIFGLR